MTARYPQGTRSLGIVVLATLLIVATAFTLLHWHRGWTDQGCQLCHVRNLPSLYIAIGVAYGTPAISQEEWNCVYSARELEKCVWSRSGRSPPTTLTFTV
jgi:hypothetical protein